MNTAKLYRLLTENKELILEPVYSELLGMVNEELAKEAEKQAGRKPVIRNAVKQFIDKSGIRPCLTMANVQELNGITYYGYCDGHKLAWSQIDFGLGIADKANSLDWTKVINVYHERLGDIPVTEELLKDLNLFIKTQPKDKWRRKPYALKGYDGFVVHVNAKYLKACLDFSGAHEIIVDLADPNKPILMHGDDDRHAMLLPIRV